MHQSTIAGLLRSCEWDNLARYETENRGEDRKTGEDLGTF